MISNNQEIIIEGSDYKVLIVDDVPSNILLLKALLRKEQYQLFTAVNGKEALGAVKSNTPDLILLDVMMPDMTGFEVSKILKADTEYSHIPIIFLTALNSTSDIVEGFKVGGSDFISKPYNKDELLIRIRHQITLIAVKRMLDKQNQELINTIKNRDRLYSVIAHDLRGPMGSIKMTLDLIYSSLDESIGEELYELLNMASQTSSDTFLLLDNLLKWTKSQLGKFNVAFQDIELSCVVDGVTDTLLISSEHKKISMNVICDEEITVNADADMIKTIARNLISNAIKFSYENSKITIKIYKEDGKAIVSVHDEGRGMTEIEKSKLLHSDTHFSSFGTNNEEGSGLGLLLCQDFINMNNGKLWFESKEGEGSTFYFSLSL